TRPRTSRGGPGRAARPGHRLGRDRRPHHRSPRRHLIRASPAPLVVRRTGNVHTREVTRVIAGEAGGRRLAVPGGRDIRPTSDRAREGLFATISSILGPLAGARGLDLYAGAGP